MDWDAYREEEDAYRQAAQSANVPDVPDPREATGGAPEWQRDLRNRPYDASNIRLGGRGGSRWQQRRSPTERTANTPSVQPGLQRANFANNPPPAVPTAAKPKLIPRPNGKLPRT